jgi:hypothetical protein
MEQTLYEIFENINNTFRRYENPDNIESIQMAEHDLHELQKLRDLLNQTNRELELSFEELPENEKSVFIDKLNANKAAIESGHANINELQQQLENELSRQKELEAELNKLTSRFNDLRTEIDKARHIEDPVTRSSQLQALQIQIQPLMDELNKRPELESSRLMQDVPINDLKSSVEKLQNIIDSDQKDSEKQIQLANVEKDIAEKSTELIQQIQTAEQIMSNPDASIEELRRSNEILLTAQPKLEEISKLYEDLDPEDEVSQQLRNNTSDQLSKLNELFNNNQQSAKDRIEMILLERQTQLSDLINQAQSVLQSPTAKPEEFSDYSSRLLESIESASGMNQPDVENLNRLIEMAHQARDSANEKADLWKKFRELRDKINEQQDTARASLEEVHNKEKRSAENAIADIDLLNVSIFVYFYNIIKITLISDSTRTITSYPI